VLQRNFHANPSPINSFSAPLKTAHNEQVTGAEGSPSDAGITTSFAQSVPNYRRSLSIDYRTAKKFTVQQRFGIVPKREQIFTHTQFFAASRCPENDKEKASHQASLSIYELVMRI
jgi:hypothetical protein